MSNIIIKCMRLCLVILLLMAGLMAEAQKKKIDLDDLTITGELHNDDRLLILSRQKNELKNFVKLRTNYRDEIIQQLPTPAPKRKN